MAKTASIKVTTDVRRDLLASAALFKNEAAVVWEYVVNSLQYVDRGVSPRVQITVEPKSRRIEISDNGRGMDDEDLGHFFRMHGENRDRVLGRAGRGKFGTGKSAAFGIAKCLRVDTRRKQLRNVVELTRAVIDSSRGDEIDLDWQVRNEATDQPNGTTVTISGIFLPRLNTSAISEFIERHLQAFRSKNPEVAVNDHICEYRQPAVSEEFKFRPSAAQSRVLGDIELRIKIAQAPLPEQDQGVFITAGPGNLVAKETAGIDRKDLGNYLFGEVDVPILDATDSLIEPYDSTRSLSLNASHPVAAALIAFIGSKLEEVRGKLVARQKEARKNEQARRLAKEAEKIAEILNQDFETYRQNLLDIRAASSTRGPIKSAFGNSVDGASDADEWVRGTENPGDIEDTKPPNLGNGKSHRSAPEIAAAGVPNSDGSDAVDQAGGSGTNRRKPRSGLIVDYKNLGPDEPRSVYDSNAFTILINLDHPVVSAALGDGSVEDPAFRRLSYEIAFSEYAMARGYMMTKQDPDMPADDVLYEVRSSLNRVSVAAAALYR